MNTPIWPVVTENLAEQMSASQGGIVHPVQLLPYLPMSIELIEKTLDELAASDRVEKQTQDGLTRYLFKESLNKPARQFLPRHCVYSNEVLDEYEYASIAPTVRQTVEAELGAIAQYDIWPAQAVWEHELVYLTQNLPIPVSTSSIAGHSRLPFKKVEARLAALQQRGVLRFNPDLDTWETPPLRYPKPAYLRNDQFIRQFPGAIKEELEIRLVKALTTALFILILCFVLAITAKFPFPLLLFVGSAASLIIFLRILKAPPKSIPEIL